MVRNITKQLTPEERERQRMKNIRELDAEVKRMEGSKTRPFSEVKKELGL